MSIEQDRRTVFIPSPYDSKIDALNDLLNQTYIYYGKTGAYKKEQQAQQDSNAESYGQSNKVERAVSKSSHAYKNESWDLVDAAEKDDAVIGNTSVEYLPKEMRSMTIEQRKTYVKQKQLERSRIQKEIQALSEKRRVYLAEKAAATSQESMLDASMIKAIKEKAKTKELRWN
jgi:hypothetical protein